MKGFLTAAQVAKRFNVTSRTVARWIDDNELPGATKVNPDIKNSPYLIPVESVEAYAQKKEAEAEAVTSDNGKEATKQPLG